MPNAAQMPLQEVLQALSRTPVTQPQLRAALATTCARWHLVAGQESEAIRHLGHALEMVPDLRPAMRLLYRIYLDRGDVRSAVMYLDQEIRATRHPREAAALYRERGLLVEAHFHDLSAAQQCYQAALKATPRDLAVLRSVERVSLARGDVFWLIANLEAQLEVLQDEIAACGVLHDLALIEARHKGDLALAADILVGALEQFPSHLILVSDLFRMAETAGDAPLMLEALELEAEARPRGGRAVPLARASVILREHRERLPALKLLQAAARDQPENISLWRSLEELAMATSQAPAALEACIGQLKAVGDEEDPSYRAELYYRLGKLALFRLDRPMEGLTAMSRAVRLTPGHPLVMEDAGRFLNTNSMWDRLLELIRLEIASAKHAGLTGEELALANLRAGQVLEERLGELDGARRCYEDAIAADQNYGPGRDRLERILHQLGDSQGLRKFYADELGRSTSLARRGFLLSVLGQLHSTDEDPQQAIKYLTALLKDQPKHLPSLQRLARLLARVDRKRELIRVTEQEISLTQSPNRKAKLLHRVGELALARGDSDAARAHFERALETVDDHLPSIESLQKLLREQGEHVALIALLRKQLLYANDRARQVAIQLEVARLLATKLGQKREALSELESLLERWPRHLPALHAAESLAATTGQSAKLLELLEQHIASVTGPRTRALLLHRAATVRMSQGDSQGAVLDLVRALELWPQLGVARARLLRLYEQLGRKRELQAFAEAGLTSERGANDRRAMALQLAELSSKPVVALQYLGTVAEARPNDYVTQLWLAKVCHEAGRPSREAGALAAAADCFDEQVDNDDPNVLGLRYLSARAAESAGNFETADAAYARILDANPEHLLAQRGRQRLKDRTRDAARHRDTAQLETAAQQTDVAAEKAAYLTIAAEARERGQDDAEALAILERALKLCPAYLPALHARTRILERSGKPEHLKRAVDALKQLAEILVDPTHRASALCRAGTLALQVADAPGPNEPAWRLFAAALREDPGSERAVRGLNRTRDAHGTQGAPKLHDLLAACIAATRENGTLRPHRLRQMVRLGSDTDGPECAVDLLERGMDIAPEHPGLHAELAQAHARLEQWPPAQAALETSLRHEVSPERRAALHYFAAEAAEKSGDKTAAVSHFLAAGQAGFHPRHALLSADRLAAETKSLEDRVTALERLIEVGDGPERAHGLRALADLHRGPLKQPDQAVDLMRQLLLLRPTDLDVVFELRRQLAKLGRGEEAKATLLAGIAHHRAWVRSADTDPSTPPNAQPVVGLVRLFRATGNTDGVYIASCVLECIAPALLDVPPDELASDPWPLPRAQETRPFDGLVGDLPASRGLDLLREGIYYLGALPFAKAPDIDLSPERSLPAKNAVVMIVRALANAMGVPQPLVFSDPRRDHGIVATISPVPCLIVGRRIASTPAGPAERDAIGRALLRLSTGGDAIISATPEQLLAILVGLCSGADVDVDPSAEIDWDLAAAIGEKLPTADALTDLVDAANRFAANIATFDARNLQRSLAIAEDRAGAVCAGDPRPALAANTATQDGDGHTLRMLVGYLLSDDHLALRRALGYHAEPRSKATPREAQA